MGPSSVFPFKEASQCLPPGHAVAQCQLGRASSAPENTVQTRYKSLLLCSQASSWASTAPCPGTAHTLKKGSYQLSVQGQSRRAEGKALVAAALNTTAFSNHQTEVNSQQEMPFYVGGCKRGTRSSHQNVMLGCGERQGLHPGIHGGPEAHSKTEVRTLSTSTFPPLCTLFCIQRVRMGYR